MNVFKLIEQGDYDTIASLIAAGISPNVANGGSTLLMFAVHHNQTNIVRLLLENGANPNTRNSDGCSALIQCAKVINLNIEIVKLLIDHGAKLNLQCIFGTTALILAVKFSTISMVKLLVDNGADISIKNKFGQDALFCALDKPMINEVLENAKNRFAPCRAVYYTDGPIPLTRPTKLNADWTGVKIWEYGCWQPATFGYCMSQLIVQLSVNPNDKIEYHVMLFNGRELYVKFPEYVQKGIYRC